MRSSACCACRFLSSSHTSHSFSHSRGMSWVPANCSTSSVLFSRFSPDATVTTQLYVKWCCPAEPPCVKRYRQSWQRDPVPFHTDAVRFNGLPWMSIIDQQQISFVRTAAGVREIQHGNISAELAHSRACDSVRQ
jgi:hypothetical protein